MNKLRLLLFLLVAVWWVAPLSAQTVQTKNPQWDDTARVVVIWNSGTGWDQLDPAQYPVGKLGEETKTFVEKSLHLIKPQIRYYHGRSPEWNDISTDQNFTQLKKDFGGKLPHVLVYINSGYVWDQHVNPKTKSPDDLIKWATAEGIGVVAVGDDAAVDAQNVFPLTGPGGTGNPVQYDNLAPDMNDLTYGGENAWVWLDKEADQNVPDGGLLEFVGAEYLNFNRYNNSGANGGGRGQADADIWEIDQSQVDLYGFVGFQQAERVGANFRYPGKANRTDTLGSTPKHPLGNKAPNYRAGYAYDFNVLSILQKGKYRVVIMCYQPQYLSDKNSSAQIVYNSIYWASKVKSKIGTPVPTPAPGNIDETQTISLEIKYPTNKKLYDLRYTTDGQDVTLTNSKTFDPANPITVPNGVTSLTVKAIGFTKDSSWITSDQLVAKYTINRDQIPKPKADPKGSDGPLSSDQTITLTVEKGGNPFPKNLYKLRYTIDGSDPKKSSKEYTAPLDVPDNFTTLTLKAIAFSEDPGRWKDSEMLVEKYDHLQKQISTPKANPGDNTPQFKVNDVTLTVDNPKDEKLYTIRYTLDGNTPTKSSKKYDGSFKLPVTRKDITLKAIAFSEHPDWVDSKVMTVAYPYVEGPLIEQAVYCPGVLIDVQTTKTAPDSLVVTFTKPIKKLTGNDIKPFLLKNTDTQKNKYWFELTPLSSEGNKTYTFEVKKIDGENKNLFNEFYLPLNSDSIWIDTKMKITSEDGNVQDNPNNRKVKLIVKDRPYELIIKVYAYKETGKDLYKSPFADIMPDKGDVPAEFRSGPMVIVEIDPVIKVSEANAKKFTASFNIVDPLGNKVSLSERINDNNPVIISRTVRRDKRRKIVVLWKTLNSASRLVNTGAYVGQLDFVDHTGRRIQRNVMLPVPR